MGLGSTFKKVAGAVSTGGLSLLLPSGGGQIAPGVYDPYGDRNQYNQLGDQEQQQREALGQKQQGQINDFAGQQAQRASTYRAQLAKSLSDTSANTFKSMNPQILEDLNSRGLFTSQTARDQEQGRLLSDLANQQNQQLTAFDTGNYNDQNDLLGQGLNANLGGEQSGLDASLQARQAGLTRQFNNADTFAQQEFASKLANKQSKDQLLQSLIGLGGQLGGAMIKRGA